MTYRSHILLVGVGLLAALHHTPPAFSAEQAPAGNAVQAEAPSPFSASAIDETALESLRGGAESITLNDMKLNGTVADTHASNLVTGHNFVTDGSLAGNAGLTTVVQNSGNNVLIQNATIINLTLQ